MITMKDYNRWKHIREFIELIALDYELKIDKFDILLQMDDLLKEWFKIENNNLNNEENGIL